MRTVSIIFDLDGTLLDTLKDLAETGNDVLLRQGFSIHPIDDYRRFVGDGLAKLVERMLPQGVDEKTVTQSVQLFGDIYKERWQRNCCLYSGIGDMLAALTEKSIPVAVLSNKPHAFTLQFCERFFPENPFSVVLGQRDGFPKKPAPDGALEICSRLHCLPENCFFVGDSNVDMMTAKNSGMTAVGVAWGFRGVEELRAHGADFIINEPLELMQYVLSAS